jgi:hypothetical protein
VLEVCAPGEVGPREEMVSAQSATPSRLLAGSGIVGIGLLGCACDGFGSDLAYAGEDGLHSRRLRAADRDISGDGPSSLLAVPAGLVDRSTSPNGCLTRN